MECPKCGSINIRRSRRRGIGEEAVLGAVAVFPYKCRDCGERFRRLRLGERRRWVYGFTSTPIWLKAIYWTFFVLTAATVLSFVVVYFLGHVGKVSRH